MAIGGILAPVMLICWAGTGSSAPIDAEKSDLLREEIAHVMEFINSQSGTDFLYKPLKVEGGTISDWQDGSTDAQTISFILQETVCFKSLENTNPDNCAFKLDGEVKQCTVSISAGGRELGCESPAAPLPIKTNQQDFKFKNVPTNQNSEALRDRLKSAECLECIFSQVPQ
ncbi:hypothetical protein XENTR_v10015787 [Xenopus tropicalis]|nr:hypothetical protein XENTR_v10015787 [Xenopus tropicalis]